jgi:isopenicillin-N N-acyltransferase-like protein
LSASFREGVVNTYPRVRISGDARQRGRAYGEQARERVRLSRDRYAEVFAHAAGWNWEQAVESAARYEKPIRDLALDVMQEIEGIAEGSGLPVGDVLAINARTEIIFAASAREAAAQRAARARECTALALLSSRTRSGRPLLAQNWDWLPHAFETVVVLEVEQPGDQPNFVTLVEAGLLAKASMNSAGLGVATNALVSSADRGEQGIPYHVMLRLMAGCETMTDALKVVQAAPRSSSANYLIAHADDVAVNIEAAPGDFRTLSWQIPQDGSLVHTNHFLSLPPGVDEVSLYAMPDSLIRLQRAAGQLSGSRTWDVKAIGELLADHAGWPVGICGHPDPRQQPIDRDATVLSVVMDLAERQMWLASGSPCTHAFEQLSFGGLLDKPSALGRARRGSLADGER